MAESWMDSEKCLLCSCTEELRASKMAPFPFGSNRICLFCVFLFINFDQYTIVLKTVGFIFKELVNNYALKLLCCILIYRKC